MKQYKVSFRGRKIGAIGNFYDIDEILPAVDEPHLFAQLYDMFEHLSNLKISELMPKDQYVILARIWHERGKGNTYHVCKVFKNGKMLACSPTTYGESYLQSAFEILQQHADFPGDYVDFSVDLRANRDQYIIDCVDVTRKKDLR